MFYKGRFRRQILPWLCAGIILMSLAPMAAGAQTASVATLNQAIKRGDVAAVKKILSRPGVWLQKNYGIAGSSAPLFVALNSLAGADDQHLARARKIVETLIAAGAPLGERGSAYMTVFHGTAPIAWISRLPGQQSFVQQLLRGQPAHQRCPLIGAILSDGSRQQWANGIADLATVSPQQLEKPACGALFAQARGNVKRAKALLEAGIIPTPQAAARVLLLFRASPGVAAQSMITDILQRVSLDTSFTRHSSRDHWQQTIFSLLVHTTVERNGGARSLQASLVNVPEWTNIITTHGPSTIACSKRNLSTAAGAWLNTMPYDSAAFQRRIAARVLATRWMVNHCSAKVFEAFSGSRYGPSPWQSVLRQGYAALVSAAAHRDLLGGFKGTQRRALRMAALSEGAYSLYTRLMRGRDIPRSLNMFLAHLTPPERMKKEDQSAEILQWLLNNGTNPNTPVEGAAPIAITRYYDRDELTHILASAGVRMTRLTGEKRELWLRRRLDAIAGFYAPRLSFQTPSKYDNHRSMGSGLDRVDLDDDGRPEYISGDGYCGNVNCQFAFFSYHDRRWHEVLSGAGIYDILPTLHNGWHDVATRGRASAMYSEMRIYQYDGTKYVMVCDLSFENGKKPKPTEAICQDKQT